MEAICVIKDIYKTLYQFEKAALLPERQPAQISRHHL